MLRCCDSPLKNAVSGGRALSGTGFLHAPRLCRPRGLCVRPCSSRRRRCSRRGSRLHPPAGGAQVCLAAELPRTPCAGFVNALPLRKPRGCGFWVRCWSHVCFFSKPPTPFQSGCAFFTFPPAVSSRRCAKAPQTGWQNRGALFSQFQRLTVGDRGVGGCCRGGPSCHSASFPWQQRPSAASPNLSQPPHALCSHTAVGGFSFNTRSLGDTVEPMTKSDPVSS